MTEETSAPSGPDLSDGLDLAHLADNAMMLGHVGAEAVLLVRRGEEIFAVGASCSHYHGPLSEGLVVGDTVRCPWHHACFSLRTGEPLRGPALDPVPCWRVERKDNLVYVREKQEAAPVAGASRPTAGTAGSIVILGGGAAANSAAETLRREGYPGRVVMVSADASVPYDRPNLSKDDLAGNAPEEWIPLRSPEFYREHGIELHLGARVTAIDRASRCLELEDGSRHDYDRLLIATGADPVHLNLPGGDLPHVHSFLPRSLADSRAIIAKTATARHAVVIGASFIGLEVAASLRTRKLEVHVVAPEAIPMERVMGGEIGGLVRTIHEQHGVHFNLGTTVAAIDPQSVTLGTGEKLVADLVVLGVGVRPGLGLAEKAGLKTDRGVAARPSISRTSDHDDFAAGDIGAVARSPQR